MTKTVKTKSVSGSGTVAAACFLGVAYLAYLLTRILQENPGIVLTIMDTYR